jgi:hypothetical protein
MPTTRPLFLAYGPAGLLALAFGLAPAPGCTTGDYCSQALDKQMECASAEQRMLFEGRFETDRKECRERKDRDQEEEKAELGCVQKNSCEEYTACINALSDARYAGKIRKQIDAALQSGEKLDEALQTCRFSGVEDADIQKLCGELFTRALDTATKDLEAMRDKGENPEGKCFDVVLMAEKVSPAAKAKVKALCDEVDAARSAQTAITEARKNLDARTLEVPYQCGIAVEDLEKIGNDWARTKLAEVTRACYVELGNAILPAVVPNMQLNCDYQVDQVYKVVKKYNLKDASLDPWIEKATAKCSGATASAAG